LNPDGSSRNVSFNSWNLTDTDENGNNHTYTIDSYDQITRVHEFNDGEMYTTIYNYDTNGNLILITDSLGNNFAFTYDSLSRKTSMIDPDLGFWQYLYDNNSNLVYQLDARNSGVNMTYDELNRVIFKNASEVNSTFVYDLQYNGTLSNISSYQVNITYVYDTRMRVVNEEKTIAGVPFEVSFGYDSQDRVISKNGLQFIYDKQGKVARIPGYFDASYNASGNILNRSYDNGLVARFIYRSDNNHLTSISIPSVQDLNYTYGHAGNIISLRDDVGGLDYNMTYDDLDRLTDVSIGEDDYNYTYNQLGSILRIVRNNFNMTFIYNNLAHAPSKVVEGGS
jgi:YD repeat-containing protein